MGGFGRLTDRAGSVLSRSLFSAVQALEFSVVLEKHATTAFKEEQKATHAIIRAMDVFLRKTFDVEAPDEDRKYDVKTVLQVLVYSETGAGIGIFDHRYTGIPVPVCR